jgi:hypothetical protein
MGSPVKTPRIAAGTFRGKSGAPADHCAPRKYRPGASLAETGLASIAIKQATSIGRVSGGSELSGLRVEIITHPGEPGTVLW